MQNPFKKKFDLLLQGFGEKGFSLLQILISLAVSATAILVTVVVLLEILKSQKIENAHNALSSLRASLMAYLDNPYQRDVTYSLIQNQMATCISNPTTCGNVSCNMISATTAQCTSMAVWQNAAPPVGGTTAIDYDPSVNPNIGFNLDEKICNGYSTAGNAQCPIRLDLVWVGQCLTTTIPICSAPTIALNVNFTFNGGQALGYSINASKYKATLDF